MIISRAVKKMTLEFPASESSSWVCWAAGLLIVPSFYLILVLLRFKANGLGDEAEAWVLHSFKTLLLTGISA